MGERLAASDLALEVRHQYLTVDQLANEGVSLVRGDLLLDERGGERCARGPSMCPFDSGRNRRAVVYGDEVLRPVSVPQRRLDEPPPITGEVETGIRRVAYRGCGRGIARQRVGQRDEIVHVEPRVAPARLACADVETGRPPDDADAAAGKESEWRRPGGHSRDVFHDRTFGGLGSWIGRTGQPSIDRLIEIGRRDEDGVANDWRANQRLEPLAEARTIAGPGARQTTRVVEGSRRLETLAQPHQRIERQQRRAQNEEIGGFHGRTQRLSPRSPSLFI